MDEDLRILERDALASGLSTDWRRYYAALARAGRGNLSGKTRWKVQASFSCQASKLVFLDPRKSGGFFQQVLRNLGGEDQQQLPTLMEAIAAIEMEWRRCCSEVHIWIHGHRADKDQGPPCATFASWRDAIFIPESLSPPFGNESPIPPKLGANLDLLRATLPLTITAPEFLGEPHVLVVREGDPAALPVLIDNPGPVQDTPFGQYHAIGRDTTIRLNPDVLPRVEWVLGVRA